MKNTILKFGIFLSIFFIMNSCNSLDPDVRELIEKEIDKFHLQVVAPKYGSQPPVLNASKKMILIPKGVFWMGSDKGKFADESPSHRVFIASFYMDETPVTYADFAKYVNAGGEKNALWKNQTYHKWNFPVTGVTWYQAVDYCNWRSKIEGLEPAYIKTKKIDAWGYPIFLLDTKKNGYRLPTEAQYEYAARGGLSKKEYPWGNQFSDDLANYDSEKGSGKGKWWKLIAVKQQMKNAYNLHDMSGNIWHWCNDWYDAKFYDKSNQVSYTTYNPYGAGIGVTKVLRGGSWGSPSPSYLRVAKRSKTAPSAYNFDIGFRCVRPAEGIKSSKVNIAKKYKYNFHHTSNLKYEEEELKIDNVYGWKMIKRLGKFIGENYANSIYFHKKIDKQAIASPIEVAKKIVKTAEKHHINPLFLTSVMVAESGFGTCSSPRWYNNPMAYHWQNKLIKNGPPTYRDRPNKRNRKFRDLEEAFEAFCVGIRKNVYLEAGKIDLNAYHLVYVGYADEDWVEAITKVYKDVAGIHFDAYYPNHNAGRLIYTNWKMANPRKALAQRSFTVVKKKKNKYYVISESFSSLFKAKNAILENPKQYKKAKILVSSHNKFRISLGEFTQKADADKLKNKLSKDIEGVWVFKY